MKNALILVAILAGMLMLSTCRISGHGPITVDASYPGYFYMIVAMVNGNGTQYEVVTPSPFQTYHDEFYDGEEFWEVQVYTHKSPGDIPPQGDLGTLEATMSGDFGELRGSAPLGDMAPIILNKSWR